MKRTITAAMLFITTSFPAIAGWYEVTNYEGSNGAYPVHVSIQTFNCLLGRDKKEKGELVGSYYSHAKRILITYTENTSRTALQLCDTHLRKEFCPFLLTPTSDGVVGKWRNAKANYDVRLKTVGKMDNPNEGSMFSGKMEVPMWYRSSKYMCLGIYEMYDEHDYAPDACREYRH